MSDFAQSGLITTLQRLNDTHLAAVEAELVECSHERPIALVLPCHAGELERPALRHLVQELEYAAWLREVVVSMNGPDPAAQEQAEALFCRLPQSVRILWHTDSGEGSDGPRSTGKGQNVAAAMRLLCEEAQVEIIAAQDCDVMSFRRVDLARLCYAVAHPKLGFQFAKAYYSRATDRLYGRVTRLFLSPLLHACVRVLGHQPLLSFLLSFRYPLAGEIALTRQLAANLRHAPGWSLEIAMLGEVFRHVDPRDVCQVDGGRGYDHKHQPAEAVVCGMAGEIATELIRQLEAECALPADFCSLLQRAYEKEAEQAVRRSSALAQINQLPFDEASERALVAGFARQLRR